MPPRPDPVPRGAGAGSGPGLWEVRAGVGAHGPNRRRHLGHRLCQVRQHLDQILESRVLRLARFRRQHSDDRLQQPILRVALIPDRFGPAAAARPDLGTYASNILIVNADVPPGNETLTDDQGNTLTLVVPPPWTDPMAASRTVPDV